MLGTVLTLGNDDEVTVVVNDAGARVGVGADGYVSFMHFKPDGEFVLSKLQQWKESQRMLKWRFACTDSTWNCEFSGHIAELKDVVFDSMECTQVLIAVRETGAN